MGFDSCVGWCVCMVVATVAEKKRAKIYAALFRVLLLHIAAVVVSGNTKEVGRPGGPPRRGSLEARH